MTQEQEIKKREKCKACVIAFAVCLADTAYTMGAARMAEILKNL